MKILMSTRKSVTRSPILDSEDFKMLRKRGRWREIHLPGTTSGLIRKLTQDVTTNMNDGR